MSFEERKNEKIKQFYQGKDKFTDVLDKYNLSDLCIRHFQYFNPSTFAKVAKDPYDRLILTIIVNEINDLFYSDDD